MNEISDLNPDEYYNSKIIKLEQLKKNAGKHFDETDIGLIKKYKNYTYDDLDKALKDENADELGKFWLCAKGNLEKKGNSVLIDEVPDILKIYPKILLQKQLII